MQTGRPVLLAVGIFLRVLTIIPIFQPLNSCGRHVGVGSLFPIFPHQSSCSGGGLRGEIFGQLDRGVLGQWKLQQGKKGREMESRAIL